tara:strand:+ start:1258 stop:2565 length:1308 start_codon:yes stop_codon:yes gene_type:complete
MDEFKNYILKCKKFDEIYDIRWKLHIGRKINKYHYKDINIGLVNLECGGYGDIIKCIKFYRYLKDWYPGIKITILSMSQKKFRELGIKTKIINLKNVDGIDDECPEIKDLRVVGNKQKFNLFFLIPVIEDPFKINDFKKLIPYANKWNTFSINEYNDYNSKYIDFPIGIGDKNLGLFLENNDKIKKQNLIKNPYALVYIQSSEDGMLHSRYCFLSFLEMIINKNKKHNILEFVIPNWIEEDILYYRPVRSKFLNITKQQFNKITLVNKKEKIQLISDKIRTKNKKYNKKELIMRADILPLSKDKFKSLINDSINDILLTGDESFVDTLNCCNKKTIWYQIAPWKENLARSLSLETGNKNYKSYKTSCGIIKGFKFKNDIQKLIKNNDFRIKGRERLDSIIIGFYENTMNPDIQKMIDIIEHSRYLHTLKNKIKNM